MDWLSCGGQNAEWLFAAGHGAGSYESGEDLPFGCRDDAVENQVYRSWSRDCVRSADLHPEPGATLFGRDHGLKRR